MDQQVNLANIFFTATEIYMLIQIFRDLKDLCFIINKKNLTDLDPLSTLINPLSTPLQTPSTNLGPVNIGQLPNTPITTLRTKNGQCYIYPPPLTVPAYVKCDDAPYTFEQGCWLYTTVLDDNGQFFGWKIETDQSFPGNYRGYDFGEADKPNRTADGLISFDYSDGQGASCIDEPITWRSRKIGDTDFTY